jgi:hypothetical protein
MEPTLYVVARYTHDRYFGGPEEGGWWYDAGELEHIVLAVRDEDTAYHVVRTLNDYRARWRRADVAYQVVELPRRELRDADQACHSYFDPEPDDYVTRWDIPTHYPESRPHYC